VVVSTPSGAALHGFVTAQGVGHGTVSGPTVAQNGARGELDNLGDLSNLSMVWRNLDSLHEVWLQTRDCCDQPIGKIARATALYGDEPDALALMNDDRGNLRDEGSFGVSNRKTGAL